MARKLEEVVQDGTGITSRLFAWHFRDVGMMGKSIRLAVHVATHIPPGIDSDLCDGGTPDESVLVTIFFGPPYWPVVYSTFLGSLAVLELGEEALKALSRAIPTALEIESSTDRFDQHVVKVPAPPIGAHGSNTALPEFNSKERPKLTPPMPIRLGSHVVHTLVDRVFSFAQ